MDVVVISLLMVIMLLIGLVAFYWNKYQECERKSSLCLCKYF